MSDTMRPSVVSGSLLSGLGPSVSGNQWASPAAVARVRLARLHRMICTHWHSLLALLHAPASRLLAHHACVHDCSRAGRQAASRCLTTQCQVKVLMQQCHINPCYAVWCACLETEGRPRDRDNGVENMCVPVTLQYSSGEVDQGVMITKVRISNSCRDTCHVTCVSHDYQGARW